MVCTCALLLTGCASVGPRNITRDRFDYVAAISDSWKRQMLLNLLKVRYADAPVFMDVASVISAYSLEGEISLGGRYASPERGDTFGSENEYGGAGNPRAGRPQFRDLMTALRELQAASDMGS